jgi:GNAT superfamily N-acetyltransferase
MQIREIAPADAPMELLLDADPYEEKVRGYRDRCTCFAAILDGAVAGVCLVMPIGNGVDELMNIAVTTALQKRGVGTALLEHVIAWARARGAKRLDVGTGTFGYQLAFYQRRGFRAVAVDRGFFLDRYPEEIREDGIQHKDMLRLALEFPG